MHRPQSIASMWLWSPAKTKNQPINYCGRHSIEADNLMHVNCGALIAITLANKMNKWMYFNFEKQKVVVWWHAVLDWRMNIRPNPVRMACIRRKIVSENRSIECIFLQLTRSVGRCVREKRSQTCIDLFELHISASNLHYEQ